MALRPLIKGLRILFAVGALLMLWQVSIVAFKIPSYILPSPAEVGRAFITSRASLTEHTVFTVVSALVGLGVSCSLAVVLAIAFVTYKPVARISMPLVIAFRSAPVTAVAPLIMLFVGRGLATSVVVIVIVSFFRFW
jgi:NitT/TauT family transport system permease protein